MGKVSLEKRLGLNEFKVRELEKAALEQGKLLAKVGAKAQHLEDHANSVPESINAIQSEIFGNQQVLEWKVDKILHMLLPDDYPDPGELTIKAPSQELLEGAKHGDESESEQEESTEAAPPE